MYTSAGAYVIETHPRCELREEFVLEPTNCCKHVGYEKVLELVLSVLDVENVGGFVDPNDPVGRVDQEAPGPPGELDAFDGGRAGGLLAHAELGDDLQRVRKF